MDFILFHSFHLQFHYKNISWNQFTLWDLILQKRWFHEIFIKEWNAILFSSQLWVVHNGNYENSLSRIFNKNFVKIMFLLLLKKWFHGKKNLVRNNLALFHTVLCYHNLYWFHEIFSTCSMKNVKVFSISANAIWTCVKSILKIEKHQKFPFRPFKESILLVNVWDISTKS